MFLRCFVSTSHGIISYMSATAQPIMQPTQEKKTQSLANTVLLQNTPVNPIKNIPQAANDSSQIPQQSVMQTPVPPLPSQPTTVSGQPLPQTPLQKSVQTVQQQVLSQKNPIVNQTELSQRPMQKPVQPVGSLSQQRIPQTNTLPVNPLQSNPISSPSQNVLPRPTAINPLQMRQTPAAPVMQQPRPSIQQKPLMPSVPQMQQPISRNPIPPANTQSGLLSQSPLLQQNRPVAKQPLGFTPQSPLNTQPSRLTRPSPSLPPLPQQSPPMPLQNKPLMPQMPVQVRPPASQMPLPPRQAGTQPLMPPRPPLGKGALPPMPPGRGGPGAMPAMFPPGFGPKEAAPPPPPPSPSEVSSWLKASAPEPELPKEVKEAGVEVKEEAPKITEELQQIGVEAAKEAAPVKIEEPVSDDMGIKLPITKIQAQQILKENHHTDNAIVWLAMLVWRELALQAIKQQQEKKQV